MNHPNDNDAIRAAESASVNGTRRPANRFTKGTGAFTCQNCARVTRDTGRGDNDGVRMCVECYELAGIDNYRQDHGSLGEYMKDALSYFSALRSYNRNPDVLFPEISVLLQLATYSNAKLRTLNTPAAKAELAQREKAGVVVAEGIDITAADRDNKAIAKLAQKEPTWKAAAKKPGKVVKTKPGKKATKNAQKPTAKAPKSPAAPKGAPSDAMLRELALCAVGKPTMDKLGSCMRMHLKMRGLISDHKTGQLTADGSKLLGDKGVAPTAKARKAK